MSQFEKTEKEKKAYLANGMTLEISYSKFADEYEDGRCVQS